MYRVSRVSNLARIITRSLGERGPSNPSPRVSQLARMTVPRNRCSRASRFARITTRMQGRREGRTAHRSSRASQVAYQGRNEPQLAVHMLLAFWGGEGQADGARVSGSGYGGLNQTAQHPSGIPGQKGPPRGHLSIYSGIEHLDGWVPSRRPVFEVVYYVAQPSHTGTGLVG